MYVDDEVLVHSKALLWRGLNHLARRNAIREGDGPAMARHWRVDMPEFWTHNHYNYLIIRHKLLACM